MAETNFNGSYRPTPSNANGLRSGNGVSPEINVIVSGPGDKRVSLKVSTTDSVDDLINNAKKSCGLGNDANVHLMCGVEALERGTNRKVEDTKIKNGSQVQLMNRCVGG